MTATILLGERIGSTVAYPCGCSYAKGGQRRVKCADGDCSKPATHPTCRSVDCQQPIVWAVSASTGRRIPLDPWPDPKGNLLLSHDRGQLLATHTTDPGGEPAFLSHFATCPYASAHRKGRR